MPLHWADDWDGPFSEETLAIIARVSDPDDPLGKPVGYRNHNIRLEESDEFPHVVSDRSGERRLEGP